MESDPVKTTPTTTPPQQSIPPQQSMEIAHATLTADNYLPVNKGLIKALGAYAALMVTDLLGKEKWLLRQGKLPVSGFFYKQSQYIREDTGVPERTQSRIFKTLKDLGLIQSRRGMNGRLYLRFDHARVVQVMLGNGPTQEKEPKADPPKTAEDSEEKDADRAPIQPNGRINPAKWQNQSRQMAESIPPNGRYTALNTSTEIQAQRYKEGVPKGTRVAGATLVQEKKERSQRSSSVSPGLGSEKGAAAPGPRERGRKRSGIATVYNDVGFLSILRRWNEIEGASTHNPGKATKTLRQAYIYYRALRDGDFGDCVGDLGRVWMDKNNIPATWLYRKWSVDEILHGIELLSRQFLPGYWPYDPDQKRRILPKSLNTSIYNPFNASCPSTLFKVMANPPKKIEDRVPEIKYPVIYEHLQDLFQRLGDGEGVVVGRTASGQADKETVRVLVIAANALGLYHDSVCDETLDEIYVNNPAYSHLYQRFWGGSGQYRSFIAKYTDWLRDRYHSLRAYFDDTGITGPTVLAEMTKPRTRTWSKYVRWLKTEHGLEIDPDPTTARAIVAKGEHVRALSEARDRDAEAARERRRRRALEEEARYHGIQI